MDRCVVHSNTFGKNNLAMACGITSLDIIADENLLANAATVGALLMERLNALKARHDWIRDIRGKGLMIGIEFGRPEGFKKKLVWDAVHKMDKGLFGELIVMPLLTKHRLLTQVSGHHQDIVKLIPPLMIDATHVDRFITALDDVLTDCDKVGGPLMSLGANLAKHVVKAKAS
jgi:4-aminobutyrate aminotransferase-like enzyme